MSFLDRLTGRSMGVPLDVKCAHCGKRLHRGSGNTMIGGGDVIRHIELKAMPCQRCRDYSCLDCAYDAGKRHGHSMACPRCGGAVE